MRMTSMLMVIFFLTASTVFNDCFIEKVFKTWGWWHHKNAYSPKLFTCNIKSSRQEKVHIPLSTFFLHHQIN